MVHESDFGGRLKRKTYLYSRLSWWTLMSLCSFISSDNAFISSMTSSNNISSPQETHPPAYNIHDHQSYSLLQESPVCIARFGGSFFPNLSDTFRSCNTLGGKERTPFFWYVLVQIFCFLLIFQHHILFLLPHAIIHRCPNNTKSNNGDSSSITSNGSDNSYRNHNVVELSGHQLWNRWLLRRNCRYSRNF